MCKLGVARIDGDINPFMANLRYFKEVLAKATSSTSSAAASAKEAAHGR
jgi:hypothetical protein